MDCGGSVSAAGAASAQAAQLRLLVVEDDAFTRLTLQTMLEAITAKMGAHQTIKLEISFANSGEEAWQRLCFNRFDIALVDIHLPGLSGLDVARSYQDAILKSGCDSCPGASSTIIIACTADHETSCSMASMKKHGVYDVLRKPVTMSDLRHMLHKWMPRDCDMVPETASTVLSQPARLRCNSRGEFAGRVLLVEDCEITRTATDLIFQQVGLCIDTAANGEEAVLMLNRREYDLLVLDVHLPQMSGYALCSWYKGMCRTQGQKTGYVVAVTANPDPQACAEFGIDTCLPKPLSTTYLVDALRGFWRSQGMPEGSPPQPYVAYGDVPPASCDTRIERAPSAAHGGNP